MTADILRGGMIGAGAWSANQLEAWSQVSGARIIALCDRAPDRLARIADQFVIERSYVDAGVMVQEEELDFLDICTQPASHSSLVRLGISRQLPILCQKPFCTSLEEAVEVVAACARAGTPLMINENFRWQAWYLKTKEVLESDLLGKPFFAKIEERVRTTLPRFDHPQAYLAEMPRLILYEMGVHYLDTLRYLFGMPEIVTARLHHISPQMRGEDVQVLLLEYPDLTAVIESSWVSVPIPGIDTPADGSPPLIARLEIDGSVGTLSLAVDGTLSVFTDLGAQSWKFDPITEADGRREALQHFVNCLQAGSPFDTAGITNLETLALVWAGYRSNQTHERVSPTELLRMAGRQVEGWNT